MQEILIQNQKEHTKIALMQDGVLQEYYEDNQDRACLEGNIYLGKVKNILPGMQAAFVDIGEEKNAFIHIKDILPKVSQMTGNKEEELKKYRIQDYIKPNEHLLVQIKKASCQGKGARITCHIHIPGRFVVLVTENQFVTVSQKIQEEEERERLLQIGKQVLLQERKDKTLGLIIRTAANGKSQEELEADIQKVIEEWESMQNCKKEITNIPSVVYENTSILYKVLLDMIDNGLDNIYVNNAQAKQDVEAIITTITGKESNIPITIQPDIQNRYDLEKQIQKSQERKVWLKCGGFITIDKTEALTAIDVNSGKYTGKKSLEETVLKVNEEASQEIAKQLRLRDIGGIIMIDFIDMQEEASRKRVIEVLQESLKKDRSKTQIVEFTKLNLLEMTRKHMWNHV